jgi:GntR family transcriptional regulator/MocR family aminotransferase
MARGHWERHLRKMRTVYKKKHEVLVQAVNRHFGDQAVIIGQGAGLHVILELLNSEFSEEELIKQALAKNIRLFPLSKTYISHTESDTRQRLIMLGFGGINTTKIDRAIELLHQTWYK